MTFDNYTDALKFIKRNEQISLEDSFVLAKLCSQYLRDENNEVSGRDLIIRILDCFDKLEQNTQAMWNDLVESAGLYPYVKPSVLNDSALLRYEYHKSPYLDDIYFHEDQQRISLELLANISVVLSAPTSFGKSLLIEEIIASRKYSNIVIIQPTLALLDETRKKLLKYKGDYKIIASTSQPPSENSSNIFLFTGERVVEYKSFQHVDFFVIDEFYKLSLGRDDERAITLNQAFYKLLKFTKKFYLLGPIIKSIPATFRERLAFSWIHTDFSTIAVDEIPIISERKLDKEEKKQELYELLAGLQEPTLIYLSAPEKATTIALGFINFIKARNLDDPTLVNNDMVEWVTENIHKNWGLNDALRNRIAFHHGAIPRHLGSSIVDAFNNGGIKYLFCTSTLIEGVNTSAKNVVLFDKRKGLKQIDYFDYRNIAGRSGRMKTYYIGNVYNFHAEPKQLELLIDIPIITQENAPLELLVYIDEQELTPDSRNKLTQFNQLDEGVRKLIKSNSGLLIEGQLKIIQEIENNLQYYNSLMTWRSYPKWDQLFCVLELAWNNLFRKGESKAQVRSARQLTTTTIQYTIYQSVSALINNQLKAPYWIENYPNFNKRVNAVSFQILNIVRHWFDYKIPKLLGAISNIQEYVFTKHNMRSGNYSFLATQLENGFLSSNYAALLEYGIPTSAIKKISNYYNPDINPDRLIKELKGARLKQMGLNTYEINKIKSSL